MCKTRVQRVMRVNFPLPPLIRFPAGRVPLCSCGWPMAPDELSSGRPSRYTFSCPFMRPDRGCVRDVYPACFHPEDGCPPCPECGDRANVSIQPDERGRGWVFICPCDFRCWVVGPVGEPAPLIPGRTPPALTCHQPVIVEAANCCCAPPTAERQCVSS